MANSRPNLSQRIVRDLLRPSPYPSTPTVHAASVMGYPTLRDIEEVRGPLVVNVRRRTLAYNLP